MGKLPGKKKTKLTREQQKYAVKRLLKYARRFLPLLIVAFILAAAASVMEHLIPVLVGNAVDMIICPGSVDFAGISAILPAILVLTLAGAVLDWVIRYIGMKVSASVTQKLRSECIRKLQHLPLSYIDSHPSGDILSRMISDIDRLSDGLITGITELYSSVLGIVVTLIFMLLLNYKVAVVVAVLTPVSMLAAAFIASRTFSLFKSQSTLSASQTALIDEAVGGREVISVFSHQDECIGQFDEINANYRQTATKAVFYSSLTNPVTRFVNSLVYCGVALAGGLISISSGGALSAGQISCLLTYSHNYAKPFNELSGVITELQSSLASALRVFEFLDTPDETPDYADAVVLFPENNSGRVDVRDVCFSYTDDPFIRNLDFIADPGKRIAIVGPTGCGKTTLINLFMRFYETDSGSIFVSGLDSRKITRKSLRDSYGMVLQDTWLSSGSVRENIIIGKPDATDEEIEAAARAAHAHSFISRLPKGYDTELGDDGGQLSQGQKQLLCITRVMLSLPPILILDEATSSIDTRTEIKIQKAFGDMMRGRTSFIVAHRLNTIRNADLILVMKDGRIIEKGTHRELMEKEGGFYRELYGAQFKGIV